MSRFVYVVHAYRWANRQDDHYLVGVFSTEGRAMHAAQQESLDRGMKYSCEVLRVPLDEIEEDDPFVCLPLRPSGSEPP